MDESKYVSWAKSICSHLKMNQYDLGAVGTEINIRQNPNDYYANMYVYITLSLVVAIACDLMQSRKRFSKLCFFKIAKNLIILLFQKWSGKYERSES
jgi:NADH:ubiquinone oxidoreductase subunit 3 (subunit A)